MNKTLNAALNLAEKGCWTAAYDLAMQDDGIDKGTTFFEWKEFAIKAITRRAK